MSLIFSCSRVLLMTSSDLKIWGSLKVFSWSCVWPIFFWLVFITKTLYNLHSHLLEDVGLTSWCQAHNSAHWSFTKVDCFLDGYPSWPNCLQEISWKIVLSITISRPDIIFVVHKLSQLFPAHLLRYIKSSPGKVIFLSKVQDISIRAFALC